MSSRLWSLTELGPSQYLLHCGHLHEDRTAAFAMLERRFGQRGYQLIPELFEPTSYSLEEKCFKDALLCICYRVILAFDPLAEEQLRSVVPSTTLGELHELRNCYGDRVWIKRLRAALSDDWSLGDIVRKPVAEVRPLLGSTTCFKRFMGYLNAHGIAYPAGRELVRQIDMETKMKRPELAGLIDLAKLRAMDRAELLAMEIFRPFCYYTRLCDPLSAKGQFTRMLGIIGGTTPMRKFLPKAKVEGPPYDYYAVTLADILALPENELRAATNAGPYYQKLFLEFIEIVREISQK